MHAMKQQIQKKVADMDDADARIRNVFQEAVKDSEFGKRLMEQVTAEVSKHISMLTQLKAEVDGFAANSAATQAQLTSWSHEQGQLEAEIDRIGR